MAGPGRFRRGDPQFLHQGEVRKAASSARGWVMVGYDLGDGSIFNYIMDGQNLWAVYNMVPTLALDVYEHA